MKGFGIIFDFLHYISVLAIIILFGVYIIYQDELEIVKKIIESIGPVLIFFIFLLTQIKVTRRTIAKRTKEANTDITLYLNCFDKLKSEIVVFSLPIIIVIIAVLEKGFDLVDILQAGIAFIIMYSWHRFIFSKEG
jgi:hypothetical protein